MMSDIKHGGVPGWRFLSSSSISFRYLRFTIIIRTEMTVKIIKSMIDEKYNGSSKWKGFISANFGKATFEIPCISEVYLMIYKQCKC